MLATGSLLLNICKLLALALRANSFQPSKTSTNAVKILLSTNASLRSLFNPASPENKFHDWRRSLSSAWWWHNSGLTDMVKPPVIILDYFGTPDQLIGRQIFVDHNLLQTLNNSHQLDIFSFMVRYLTWYSVHYPSHPFCCARSICSSE